MFLKLKFFVIFQLSTFDVQHILARSEERLFPGACIKLAIKYNGQQNTLHEDRVKMTLKTGKAKLLIIIPTKVWFSLWFNFWVVGTCKEYLPIKGAPYLYNKFILKEMIVFNIHSSSMAVSMSKR